MKFSDTEIEIEISGNTLRFRGALLGVVDNERRGRPRWAEIELYRYLVSDPASPHHGQQRYLLHTLGHSVVYHRYESNCNQGIPVPVEEFALRAEFPDDLEPCRDTVIRGRTTARGCYPPDWRTVPAGTMFDLELLRHSKWDALDAEGVLNALKRPEKRTCDTCGGDKQIGGVPCPDCNGRGFAYGERMLSAPGERLLEMVRVKDPDIAAAMTKTVTL